MKLRLSCTSLAGILILSACAHTPGEQATASQELALEEVRQAYEEGSYSEVARQVGLSVELQSAPLPLRTEALKLQAYSYCLLEDIRRCERSFGRLLMLEPAFELPANERQHPMWGPPFERARMAMQENT